MRRGFDNLYTCVWLCWASHGRLWDWRLKQSGMGIREFIESEELANTCRDTCVSGVRAEAEPQ